MEGLVGVKEEYFRAVFLFGKEPFLSEVDEAATINEHEHLDRLVAF